MFKSAKLGMFALDGNEAMMYNQFVKLFGTREKINDVTSPRYTPVGDIMLPRNSLIHYQQQHPGEVGPSNTAPFISNFDKRINMFFNVNYEVILGSTKIQNVPLTKTITGYEGSHFIYNRTRNYTTVVGKEGELLVNNLAIGQLPVLYKRRTVFTPYQKWYNDLYTLVGSINEFSKYGRHQFIEIQLPRTFPTYKTLELMFDKYKKFFNEDGEVVRMDKIPLAPFQAEQSFWLLDLYGCLMGFDNSNYSLLAKLNEDAKKQLEIIFTYNGKCWIVNLQNLMNLISYSDKETDEKPGNLKINYFKRFYVSLISLVTPILAEPEQESEQEAAVGDNREDKGSSTRGSDEDETSAQGVPGKDTAVDGGSGPSSLADLYSSSKRSTAVQDSTSRDEGKETNNETPSLEVSIDEEGEDVGADSWGQDISDDVFEQASVENAAIAQTRPYSPTASIERELDELARTGQLTSKEREFFEKAANTYKDLAIGGRTIEEIIDIKPEDMKLTNDDISPDSIVIRDKAALKSRTEELKNAYNSKMLRRNIIEMIVFAQNGKVAVTDLDMEQVVTADSMFDVYTIRYQPIKGSQSTRRIRIPTVMEDGTFTMNGVKSYAQLMRMEAPIRKISPTKVALTSYYDKKVMVERSTKAVDDFGRWLKASIIERSYVDKSIRVSLGGFKPPKDQVCYYYSILASRFKAIETPLYHFDFDTTNLVTTKAWAKLCNDKSWVIGKQGEHPIIIDNAGLVTIDGVEKGYIEELLGLNIVKAPIPCATVNVNGFKFPAVVVLSYWTGFSNLLKMLKADYRTVDPDQRPQLAADEYLVSFADERLIFNRRDELTTLILSGLRKLPNLHNFSRSHLDDPNVWFSLIGDPRVKPTHFKEMTLLYDMFIEPIMKRLLEEKGYPVVMDELVIEACKLLLNNESKHEIEITEQRFVGYERFAGHVYREQVKATRQYRNKPNNGKKTFDLNPDAVMMNIITDSSCQAMEEVNPIHQIKSQEEYTFGGTLGRSDRAMVRRTRGQLPNYAGIVSEAGKDSGKVGFIGYLTSDAKIVDLYGNVDVNAKATTVGRGSVVMNALYGTTKDDTKRTLFSGVQQSQVMAADNYVVNPLRTSYDSQIAYRTSELYSSVAKQKGKVTEVTPYGMTVTYEDGTEGKFPLGYEIGKGAGEYHKHNKVTDMAVGQEFDKGQILAWNELFFDRDMVDPTRVAWKSGGMARIALIEDQFTFEDSIGISKDFSEASTSPFLKPNDFKVLGEQSIKLHVKVGDVVEYDQILCDIENPVSSVFEYDDADSFEGLDRIGIKQVKAKQSGKIAKIEVFYNAGDLDDWDESLRTFIKKYDGVRAKSAEYKSVAAKTGNVGINASIGKSKIYLNTAVVYIYIENTIKTTTADKFVVGNQMKGTVGFIYENLIYTLDGRPVHITFSLKSLLNRMVLSLRDKLVANEVNNVYTQRMISKYGKY
ncbi:putative virion-associated RNA polymerase beta subunit [Pseudomonas phage OBP]|uniref:RNA polymerase beta subunit n=1 Tax=Pseudomonas phage OBP TaxID=1124849 RepID=UPI000240D5FF|nr:RNA polymerase beta subunit [Pseudomonas phage OBP]AEV89715.1 putative virion-associated RNA polymerase beta subunit [Pseudomonas phage OBP]